VTVSGNFEKESNDKILTEENINIELQPTKPPSPYRRTENQKCHHHQNIHHHHYHPKTPFKNSNHLSQHHYHPKTAIITTTTPKYHSKTAMIYLYSTTTPKHPSSPQHHLTTTTSPQHL
jgi:hypothetical protein